jgi:hypothetical protein
MDYGLNYPFHDYMGGLTAIGTNLGKNLGKGVEDYRIRQAIDELGPNASWEDKANVLLKFGDTDGASRLGALGIADQRNQIGAAVAQAKINKPRSITPTDRKLIATAEDEIPSLQGNIENLSRALELNDKTFTGATAGVRTYLGSKVADDWMPDQIADKKTADITSEWQSIMSPEAISQMSANLKGATTDFELRRFEALLADPSTPPQVRRGIINRMLTLSKRQLEVKQGRIKELRGAATGSEGATPPPQSAIDFLIANPDARDAFEEKYGVSADEFLGE